MAAVRMGKVSLFLPELCALSVSSAAEERIQKPPVRPEQSPRVLHALPRQWLTMGFASTHTTPGGYTGAQGGCKGVYVFVGNGMMNMVQSGEGAGVYLKTPHQEIFS